MLIRVILVQHETKVIQVENEILVHSELRHMKVTNEILVHKGNLVLVVLDLRALKMSKAILIR